MNINRLFKQSVTLETYLGSGAYGDVFAAPVTVACFIEDATKLVRNSSEEEVVSTTTLYAAIAGAPAEPPVQGQFSAMSRVAVNGRDAHVITTARVDSAGPARIHHIQVSLT